MQNFAHISISDYKQIQFPIFKGAIYKDSLKDACAIMKNQDISDQWIMSSQKSPYRCADPAGLILQDLE